MYICRGIFISPHWYPGLEGIFGKVVRLILSIDTIEVLIHGSILFSGLRDQSIPKELIDTFVVLSYCILESINQYFAGIDWYLKDWSIHLFPGRYKYISILLVVWIDTRVDKFGGPRDKTSFLQSKNVFWPSFWYLLAFNSIFEFFLYFFHFLITIFAQYHGGIDQHFFGGSRDRSILKVLIDDTLVVSINTEKYQLILSDVSMPNLDF